MNRFLAVALIVIFWGSPTFAQFQFGRGVPDGIKSGEKAYILGCVIAKSRGIEVCGELDRPDPKKDNRDRFHGGDSRPDKGTIKAGRDGSGNDWNKGGPRGDGGAGATVSTGGGTESNLRLISLKSAHGTYLRVVSPLRILADRKIPSVHESFFLEVLDKDHVAFVSWQGLYVCCEPDGTLVANRSALGKYEKWTVVRRGSQVSFRSVDGRFLTAEPGGKVTGIPKIASDHEAFTIVSPECDSEEVIKAQHALWRNSIPLSE
ncbi:MAG: hypothetical protein V4719_20470 [Planctomycetota bacterium]